MAYSKISYIKISRTYRSQALLFEYLLLGSNIFPLFFDFAKTVTTRLNYSQTIVKTRLEELLVKPVNIFFIIPEVGSIAHCWDVNTGASEAQESSTDKRAPNSRFDIAKDS
jgi:hypothetical protein